MIVYICQSIKKPKERPYVFYPIDRLYNINGAPALAGNVRQKIFIVITDEKEQIIDTLDQFDNAIYKDAEQKYEAFEIFYRKHKDWLYSGRNYATKLEKNGNQYTATMCYSAGEWCSSVVNNEYTACHIYRCKRYTITNTAYDSLQLYKMDMMQKPYCKTFKNGKIGLLAINGDEIIPCVYDDIDCSTGDCIVTDNQKKGFYFTKAVLKQNKMSENEIKFQSITPFEPYYKMKLATGKTGYWVKIRRGNGFAFLRMI